MKFDKNLHVASIDGEHYDDKLKVAFTAKVPTQLFNAMKRMRWSPTMDTPVMHVKQFKSLSKWRVFRKGSTYITFWVTDESKIGIAVSFDGKNIAMANTIKYDLNAIKRLVKNVEKKMSEDINEAKKGWHVKFDETFDAEDGSAIDSWYVMYGKHQVGRIEDARDFDNSIDIRSDIKDNLRVISLNRIAGKLSVEKVFDKFMKTPAGKKWIDSNMLESVDEAKRLDPSSMVVSLKDFNQFTLVLGAQYDDITSIRMGEVDAPKDVINNILKPLKVPAMMKKTGRGRYDLTFRNNAEMNAAYSAFHKKGYKVTNKTVADPKTVAKIKSRLPLMKEDELNEAPKFEIGPYQRTHGKAPKGHGMWAFTTEPQTDPSDDRYWFFSDPSTLNAAKKQAAKHFKGATHIYIMP